MANPTVTTAPTQAILTAAQVREQFKYLETAEDGLIDAMIAVGATHLETSLRRAFVQRTYTYYLTGFYDEARRIATPAHAGEIVLPWPPLISIVSVKYRDVDGNQQTVDAAEYVCDIYSEPGRIKPAANCQWPSTQADVYNTVEIAYNAGYASAAAVPEHYKYMVRWIVALWWRNREPVSPADLHPVPHTVDEFIEQFRCWRVGA